jgi:cell division protein FtsZ
MTAPLLSSFDIDALEAAQAAVASPLLETSMDGARKILLSITGGEDLSLFEVNDAAKAVSAAAHPDANIIFGAMVDEKLEDEVWVTVVATGYADQPTRRRRIEEEPDGEPRIERRTPPRETRDERPAGTATRRTGLGVNELDVPEFVPRR